MDVKVLTSTISKSGTIRILSVLPVVQTTIPVTTIPFIMKVDQRILIGSKNQVKSSIQLRIGSQVPFASDVVARVGSRMVTSTGLFLRISQWKTLASDQLVVIRRSQPIGTYRMQCIVTASSVFRANQWITVKNRQQKSSGEKLRIYSITKDEEHEFQM